MAQLWLSLRKDHWNKRLADRRCGRHADIAASSTARLSWLGKANNVRPLESARQFQLQLGHHVEAQVDLASWKATVVVNSEETYDYDESGSSRRENILRYLFDLTTSADWIGPPVGLIRVERELARRARQQLGQDVQFCVFDRRRNGFFLIDNERLADVIDGRLQIKITPTPLSPPRIPPERMLARLQAMRLRARRGLLRYPALYHTFQWMRGSPLTREDALRLRREELFGQERTLGQGAVHAARSLITGEADLGTSTTVINVGLDWEFNRLPGIGQLKRTKGFQYLAVVHDLIPIKLPAVCSAWVSRATDCVSRRTLPTGRSCDVRFAHNARRLACLLPQCHRTGDVRRRF